MTGDNMTTDYNVPPPPKPPYCPPSRPEDDAMEAMRKLYDERGVDALAAHIMEAGKPRWQPIDTAPSDKAVLVWDAHLERPVVAQKMTAIEDGSVDWIYARRLGVEDAVAFICTRPTHWMGLPSPPEISP